MALNKSAKVNKSGNYKVAIENIAGNVVSKENIELKLGSNIHKIYVKEASFTYCFF